VSYLSVGAATVALQQAAQEQAGAAPAHADACRQALMRPPSGRINQ